MTEKKSFFGGSWAIFKSSFTFLFKEPVFLVPIFTVWIILAAFTLYLRYYFEPPFWISTSLTLVALMIYLFIFFMAFVISMGNIVMLELMQQLERGHKTNLSKAVGEAIGMDLIRVIPIAAVWAVLWFIIVILKVLTSKKRDTGKVTPSLKDAGKTLSGMNSPFNLWHLGLDMTAKAIRMFFFLVLPAVAWEDKGAGQAFEKGWKVLKTHPGQFLAQYGFTLGAVFIMALPLLPVYILDKLGYTLPPIVWTLVIIWAGLVWTMEMYLEQMSVGILYLWHMKWVKKGSQGDLTSVTKPDLFDEIYELR